MQINQEINCWLFVIELPNNKIIEEPAEEFILH